MSLPVAVSQCMLALIVGVIDVLRYRDMNVLPSLQATDKEDIQKACSELAERAYVYSHDTNYLSPFAREGCEALSWRFYGGKPDDITVILAGVANAEES